MNKPFRYTPLLLMSALLISACSSSGNSGSVGIQILTSGSDADEEGMVLDEGTEGITDEMEDATSGETTGGTVDVSPEDTDSTTSSSAGGTSAPVSGSEIELPTESAATSTTRVDFEITVPAYSSDQLQVRVVWGDFQEAAAWVGDEYWTLSGDFPSNTERDLLVTFYDRNGDVTLATYESMFSTGFNSAQNYQIFAEQFDSSRWDTDGDGLSNLDESILGGDSVQLNLRDSYFGDSYFGEAYFVSSFHLGTSTYESQVPDERPYYEHLDIVPDVEDRPDYIDPRIGLTQTLTIDIDDSGTGTFDDYQYYLYSPGDYTSWTYAATRTNTGDSVIWNGRSSRDNQGEVRNYFLSSVEVKRVDAQTFSADGAYSQRWNGHNPAYLNIYEYALIGEPVAESTACEPLSGTLTHEYLTGGTRTLNRISKGVDDQFWTVVETAVEVDGYPDESSEYPDELAEIVDSYLTRKLGITFHCDYPELR